MTLGEVLRELLEERGITQKNLAKSLNISASTLGNYIQNTREPDYAMLKAFADYFDVSTDYLLNHRTNQALNHLEDALLHIFRSLTAEQQALFMDLGRVLVSHRQKKETNPLSRQKSKRGER